MTPKRISLTLSTQQQILILTSPQFLFIFYFTTPSPPPPPLGAGAGAGATPTASPLSFWDKRHRHGDVVKDQNRFHGAQSNKFDLLTFERCIQESSTSTALPDCCTSRAHTTPSAKLLTWPLTRRAAAAFRIWETNPNMEEFRHSGVNH